MKIITIILAIILILSIIYSIFVTYEYIQQREYSLILEKSDNNRCEIMNLQGEMLKKTVEYGSYNFTKEECS